LKVGDKILNSKGELKTLIGKSVEALNEPERIYNINVDEFHTYFVGESELLVHNDCTDEMTDVARHLIGRTDEQAIADGITDVTEAQAKATGRPSWRQSEIDAAKDFPDYTPQVSYKKMPNGTIQEVPYGTSGSVRPDYYKPGHSVDIKNYNVTTSTGRSNLANNIEKQYQQRLTNLPAGTKQTVMIDIRGQSVSEQVIDELYNTIVSKTGGNVEIRFKTN
jgi:hypothetical protein